MAAASRASGAASYADRIHQFSEDHSRVTVYNRRTGRVVWHRSVAYIYWAVWSRDRRALALVDAAPPSADTAFRLTVWRAGRRARSFLTTRPLPSLDAIGYLAWSPDDKRLLMLGATGQGGASVGYWDLWCLNVDRGRTVKLVMHLHRVVTEARWIGRRRIRFRTISFFERNGTEQGVVDRTPHEWTCP